MTTATDYSKKAMLVTLKISKWTARRTDKRVTAKVLDDNGAAATSGRFTKNLIDNAAFSAMDSVTNEARAYHNANTLPWDGDGRRVLSASLFMDYRSKMSAFEDRYSEAVRDFIGVYPRLIDDARVSLNGMFDSDDYPAIDDLQSKFGMGVTPEPVPTGNSLHIDIATEYLDEQRAVIEQRVMERMREAHRNIYDRLLTAVKHMHGQIEDGVQFRNATIDNITEICDLIPDLTIEDDMRLKDLAVSAKAAATRFSREAILTNATDAKLTKNDLARQVKAIEDSMSAYF